MIGRVIQPCDQRLDIPPDCYAAIDRLREAGWAVAVIKPSLVGNVRCRGRVEMSMTLAGVNRARELQTFSENRGRR